MITRHVKRRVRVMVTTASLLAMAVLPAGSVSEATVAPTTDARFVGTFNIYGNVGHRGDAGNWIRDEADAIKALTRGDSDRWLFIALQETCKNQGERFAREMGMRSAFVDTGVDCADGQPYGNTILFHSALRILPPALLPNPDGVGGDRGIICALVRTPGSPGPHVVACSTHLSVGDTPDREAQTTFIHDGWRPDGIHPLGAYGSVVVAGDFNALPGAREMDVMYGGSEADGPPDTRPPYVHPTYDDGRKIDYLFSWGTRGPGRWSDTGVRLSDNSDHNFFYSKLTWG